MNVEQNIDQLPKDWKVVDVSSIGRIETGSTPSKQNSTFYNNDYPFYKPTDLQAGYNVRIANDNLSEAGIKQARYLPENSILVTCIGATIGKTGLIRKAGVSNQQINAIIPSENVEPSFIYYQVIGPVFQKLIKDNASATTLPILNKSKFQSLPFVIAPLKEQQQIVSKIEELFSEVDKGIEEIKTAQQQLKVYRQAVLKWAFEGKLASIGLNDGRLPKAWKEAQVKDVAETYGGFAFKSGDFKGEGKYQVLRMGNVRPGILRYDESPVFLDDVEESVLSRSLLQVNDVIITQTGTRKKRDYGFTALIPKSNLLLNQRIAAIRFKGTYLPKFFLYFSWTDFFKDQFFANETGNVGQGNVGMKAVTETLIPFCSLEEQQQIVQEIESRLSVCDKIEETITNSLKQAEALRQSILKKAFEGKLV